MQVQFWLEDKNFKWRGQEGTFNIKMTDRDGIDCI